MKKKKSVDFLLRKLDDDAGSTAINLITMMITMRMTMMMMTMMVGTQRRITK